MKPVLDCEVTFEKVRIARNALVLSVTLIIPWPDGVYSRGPDEPVTKQCVHCGRTYPGTESCCPLCSEPQWREFFDEIPF